MIDENEDKEKLKKDMARVAVALAMKSRWSKAESQNRSILSEFPDDIESHNRLGKALTELGKIDAAMKAFQKALDISPHNTIASKNLERLMHLGGEVLSIHGSGKGVPNAFIEESGRSGVTNLINVAGGNTLLRMAPGHSVEIGIEINTLKVTGANGEYLGQIEPRLAVRLSRLINGGNRYEASVISVGHRDLAIIIREVYHHPSQAGIVSFPSQNIIPCRVPLPNSPLGTESGLEGTEYAGQLAIKDWSNDDTEPGDDDVFSPVVHRIIDADNEGKEEDENY